MQNNKNEKSIVSMIAVPFSYSFKPAWVGFEEFFKQLLRSTGNASKASSVLSFMMAPIFSATLRSGDDPGHWELSKKSILLRRRSCCVGIAFIQGALSWRKVTSLGSMTFFGLRRNGMTRSRMIELRK